VEMPLTLSLERARVAEGRCYVIYTGEAVLARVIIHLFVAQAVTSISQSDNAP